MVYVTNLKKVHEKIITHIEKKEKQCYYKYIIILSSESQTTYGLKGKFRIILQKILQIYVSIILEFSLSYNKISSF